MTNLISREAVIALINASISDLEYADENIAMQEAIKMLPTIEAESNSCEYWDGESHFCALHILQSKPIKHGRWIKTIGENGVTDAARCNICGFEDNRYELFNYCPKCGSRMDEVEK